MGTRAQFFIGDPQDLQAREWLGTVAWDGHANGDCGDALRGAKTAEEFKAGVAKIAAERKDFGDPAERSFPFPWKDDLFLTDVTFAFFDGEVRATYFHSGFRPLEFFYDGEGGNYGADHQDELPKNVMAPVSQKPPGPDSIMILSVR